jgi:hypothetical protein
MVCLDCSGIRFGSQLDEKHLQGTITILTAHVRMQQSKRMPGFGQ